MRRLRSSLRSSEGGAGLRRLALGPKSSKRNGGRSVVATELGSACCELLLELGSAGTVSTGMGWSSRLVGPWHPRGLGISPSAPSSLSVGSAFGQSVVVKSVASAERAMRERCMLRCVSALLRGITAPILFAWPAWARGWSQNCSGITMPAENRDGGGRGWRAGQSTGKKTTRHTPHVNGRGKTGLPAGNT